MTELRIDGVSKAYGSALALSDVSIIVPSGGRTAIVGPSGSGKTTLLRLIAGFEMPDAGGLTMGTTLLAENGAGMLPHRRNIGYVAQEGALFPHLTVRNNIGFGMARNVPDREDRIVELIARVGLPMAMLDRRPHQLSGGQQQRVALARALSRQPAIMLLDEPFSSLDAGLRDDIRTMVAELLGDAGVTTILVTHDQREALSFADHLVVLRDGQVMQAGSPGELYQRPIDPQTAQLLGDAIVLDAQIAGNRAKTVLGSFAIATDHVGTFPILLRPEQLSIADASHDGCQVKVISRSYEGASWRLTVAPLTETGPLATAPFDLTVPGTAGIEVGDVVAIAVSGPAHVFGQQS